MASKAKTGPNVTDFVPEYDGEDEGERLPVMPIADMTGRNMIIWGVKWVRDRAYSNQDPKETWLLEVSENGDDAPTYVAFVNQTALVGQLRRMGDFPRRVHILGPDSSKAYYRFVTPTQE